MQSSVLSRIGSELAHPLGISALLLLALAPTTYAAVYKCTAKDGSTAYSDMPCDNKPEVVDVTPAPLHSTPVTPPPLAPGQARVNETRERIAVQCATSDYNDWYRAQSPKPTPEEAVAKRTATAQKCRAALKLPDAPTNPPTQLSPATIATSQSNSARETSALLCSTKTFNEWIKTQSHPLPDPNVRIAKMIEISNQCRRPLGLSDMIRPAPIPTPKPILQGPAGTAAAAKLLELVKSGSVDQLQKYLSTPGVDINDRPGNDEALLDYAAEQNQVPIARFLLDHDAHVDAAQTQGQNRGLTALHRAAIADAADVAQLLLAHGAEVNVHGPLGITPLILAASNGSGRTAQVLLDHGADVLTADGHSDTALSRATTHNHPDIVRSLLIHLVTPTSTTMNAVAMRGDVDALRPMLRHDELVHDVPATLKNEALRFTILGPERFEERKQMIELLLANGADIDNMQPGIDVIPVMLAQTPAMAEFLLAHGANKKAKLSGPRLAQWIVCNNSGKDPKGTLQVFVAHGTNISGATSRGESAMPCAERLKNPELIAFLAAQQVGSGRPAQASSNAPALFPHRPCIRLDQRDNTQTPLELYASLTDCLHNSRDDDAVDLFILAGMDSAFDSVRVSDKTAGQARQILIMALFQSMPANEHDHFNTAMKELTDHPLRHALLCHQVKNVGPPTYFPSYMVNHGMGAVMGALSNQAPAAPLVPNFDATATWKELQANYLNCPQL
jgi:Ankyrin repeats (3 copies)/Domain of unknown function (DUF4124)/Ankyrin repeat